jgi:anti-repressor protein
MENRMENQLVAYLTLESGDEQFPISGRVLYKALELDTPYAKWFQRMAEYGFDEGRDFRTDLLESTGGRPATDHALTLAMAKHLCMVQRTPQGMAVRQRLIDVEKAWNTPDAVIARGIKMAEKQLAESRAKMRLLGEIAEANEPKVKYFDAVLDSSGSVSVTTIAKTYGKTAQWLNELLHEKGIQYKQGKNWFLYQHIAESGYMMIKTAVRIDENGETHTNTYTRWTQKGKRFIHGLLADMGIFPVAGSSDVAAIAETAGV